MIIEHFKNQDPVPVYRRFRDRGRLAPESLQYVSSWVDEKLERCFQLMETENLAYLEEWLKRFSSRQRDPRNRLVSESTRGSFSKLFDRYGRRLTGNWFAENIQFGEP